MLFPDRPARPALRAEAVAPNRFVIGQEAVQRTLTVFEECALAAQAVWRT